MNKKYYYFVASFPEISFDAKAPYTMDAFLPEAERLLSPGDFLLLKELLEDRQYSLDTGNHLAREWIIFNRKIKNIAARRRSQNFQKDPRKYVHGELETDLDIENVVAEAMKASNPLEAARILDKARWEFLEERTRYYYFDFYNVLAFGLKLDILQRYQDSRREEGRQIFDRLQEVNVN